MDTTLLKLRGSFSFEDGELLVRQGELSFVINAPQECRGQIASLLARASAGEDVHLPELTNSGLASLVSALAEHGLIAEQSRCQGLSGIETLLLLEDYANDLLYTTLYKNVFWANMQRASPNAIPHSVLYGFVIENYHVLCRESWFDSPALSYPAFKGARLLMNQFYGEEFGHDALLLASLGSISISREDLEDSIPLPDTLALCNGLAFWASYDPLFFFTTLGILEGKDVGRDSFLDACERLNLSESFIGPLRKHSDINLKGGHGSLSREIFKSIPFVAEVEIQRMKVLTAQFIDLYDAFYSGIWKNYASGQVLLRRISEV